MKNAYNSILLLSVIGLAVLIAGAVYFGAPLFGWLIMIAIFVVFIVDQFKLLSALKKMRSEEDLIETCEKRQDFSVSGDGIVARRLSRARELLNKGVRLDSAIAFEVLSSSSSVPSPRSSGGTVILLGLMGTFFGLMYSVATAGVAIDNSSTQGTLDTIQVLFGNMKGIFGTSLCGLFAALVLNASRGLFLSSRDSFVARLDSLTLDMQGESQQEESEGDRTKNELERLFESVEKNLAAISASAKTSLDGVVKDMNTKVVASVDELCKSVNASLTGVVSPMGNDIKALATTVEAIPNQLDEKLKGISVTLDTGLSGIATSVKGSLEGVSANVETALAHVASDVKSGLDGVAQATENAMKDSSKNVAEAVAAQVSQSDEQWKAFMDKLAAETSANVESQKEGLETLKNVALQVAEKAQAGSAELSASVSEKLSALSTDILGAFQKLSDTSAVLLEAQKALTESIDNRVVKEKEATDALGGNIVETAELMRVNQSELSANLEMLRAGLETILEKLSGDTAEHEDEENFVEHLNQSLEAFHERASEVLMENAVKTQEILLEVLEQTQRAARLANPKAEG